MSKHTPGPWKVISEQAAREVEVFEIADISHFRVICEGRGDGFASAGDAFADARLIAAAPELLEALRNLYMSAPTSTECNAFHHSKEERHAAFEPCQPAKDYLSALSHARAAILKATGEQP